MTDEGLYGMTHSHMSQRNGGLVLSIGLSTVNRSTQLLGLQTVWSYAHAIREYNDTGEKTEEERCVWVK